MMSVPAWGAVAMAVALMPLVAESGSLHRLPVPHVRAGCFNERFVQPEDTVDSFSLAHGLVDVNSIQTFVDGTEVSRGYNPATGEIRLAGAGQKNSVIDLQYCLEGYPKDLPVCNAVDCADIGL